MENIEKCSGVNCPMQMGYDVANCQVKDCPFRTKPLNRYDLIRHFTIDQMAEFMREMLDCVSCQNKMMNNNNPFGKEKCNDIDYYKMCGGDYRKCLAICKKWLEGEVD